MKRIICLAIAVLMLVTVFSACGNKTAGKGTALPSNVSDDGMFVYSITRGSDASSTAESAAKQLRTDLKKGLDCNIIILKDSVEDFDENYEILVGLTNRQESVDAYNQVKNNRPNNNHDFLIKVVDDKICIAATADPMLEIACEWFAKTFGTMDNWGKLSQGYEFLYEGESANSVVNTIAGESIGVFNIVTPQSWTYLCGRAVREIVESVEATGFPLNIGTDLDAVSTYEILVGDNEREESKAVEVSGDSFIIKVAGTKLIIKGGNELATRAALDAFKKMVDDALESKQGFTLEDGYVLNGKYDAAAEGAYTLNFDDEFNGNTLNFKYWANYGTDFGDLSTSTGASCLGGKSFKALYSNTDYIRVSDGNLLMTTAKINDADFVSTSISTLYSMVYRYGFWEVRMKLPESPGCVSLWNNAAYIGSIRKAVGSIDREAFTEVDLIETFGSNTSFHANVHRWWEGMDNSGNGSSMGHTSLDGDPAFNNTENNKKYTWRGRYEGDESTLSDDYHIYSYYSDDKIMEFAFDGVPWCIFDYKTQSNSISIHCMQNYLVMSNGMGAPSYGTKWKEGMPEKTTSVTDWTRIYQTSAVTSQMRYGDGYKKDASQYTTSLTYVYPEQRRSY